MSTCTVSDEIIKTLLTSIKNTETQAYKKPSLEILEKWLNDPLTILTKAQREKINREIENLNK